MILGVEGPCCAGKTTLSGNLAKHYGPRVIVVPDYADFVGGGRHLPPAVPISVQAELDALTEFENIERERLQRFVMGVHPESIIVIDRCVHTLLAHCYALKGLLSEDFYTEPGRKIESSPHFWWPDHIVYIDTPYTTICERNNRKFLPGNVFIDKTFNEHFRNYFVPKPRCIKRPCPPCLYVNACKTPEWICGAVAAYVESSFRV